MFVFAYFAAMTKLHSLALLVHTGLLYSVLQNDSLIGMEELASMYLYLFIPYQVQTCGLEFSVKTDVMLNIIVTALEVQY
jgi:hypothetical protein